MSVDVWERARDLRSARTPSDAEQRAAYLLTGLVWCAGCGNRMAGSVVGGYRMYVCPHTDESEGCARTIGAASLEDHVEQEALRVLEEWDSARATRLPVTARRPVIRGASPGTGLPGADTPDTDSVREDHTAWHEAIVLRSAADLDGVTTGPQARDHWPGLPARRREGVLRYLFAAVRIWPKTTCRGVFDTSRIDVVANPL